MHTTITLLPEFHLTGFSQQEAITQSDATILAEAYDGQVMVAGYVERHGSSFYSSAIVVDENGSIYNVRKSGPWGNAEKAWMSGSGHAPFVLDLSIGRTLVIICADAFETRYGAKYRAEQVWGHERIDWVLVPSHWQKSFEDMLIRRGVLRLVRAVGNPQWVVSDTYHGRVCSSEWEA
jgi:predicted amidohydrolase